MDVNKTLAVTPTGQSGPRKEQKREDGEKQQDDHDSPGEAGGSPWADTEAFAMEGILAGDLSPEIQKAFEDLTRQIEPLRAELERAQGRQAHFKELAETHSFLPLPGRREFLRELTHVVNNMENLNPPPSLVLLHLSNADEVRRRFGRKALDGLLTHVCAAIDSALLPTDVAGSLGGNDFGVILLVASGELAQTRAQNLVEAIRKQPFPWQGEKVTLEVIAGVTALESNGEPEAAIAWADRDLIGDVGGSSAPQEQTDGED